MTTKDPKIPLLRAVPALAGCNDRQLTRVAPLFDEHDVEASEVLMREGTPAGETFLVIEGQARVTLRGEVLATVGPGEFVGEMALLDHSPRSATVTATTPMHLLVLAPGQFASLLNQPAVARRIAVRLAQRLRVAENAPSYDVR